MVNKFLKWYYINRLIYWSDELALIKYFRWDRTLFAEKRGAKALDKMTHYTAKLEEIWTEESKKQ